ncbi:hypothetical protein NMG60_11015538 [Bertholletia excelsa]
MAQQAYNLSCLRMLLVMVLMTKVLLVRVKALLPVAKDNCQNMCGGVLIPFPFGMGEGCFINSWFEVECRYYLRADGYGPSWTPFLRTLNVEIHTISLEDRKVRVRSPIMTWNCGDTRNRSETPINLDGSPFFYSQTANSLTMVGSCNTLVAMKDQDDKTISWCTPDCDESSPPSGSYDDWYPSTNSCYGSGLDCCQAPLPPNLQQFNLGLGTTSINFNKTNCTLAFLVCEHYPIIFSRPDWTENLPMELDWELYNVTAASLGIDGDSTVYCGMKTNTTHINGSFFRNSSLQCFCRTGYGNPYLPYGCVGNIPMFFITCTELSKVHIYFKF